jgi:hypothetical protein
MEAGGDTNTADVSDDGLHCTKTDSYSCLGIADPTKTEAATMGFSNIDSMDNHTLSYIKTEYSNIDDIDEHDCHCIKTRT